MKYLNDMDDIYKNIWEHNSNKKALNICFWWYYCWSSNEKLNPIVTELLIRGRKLNIFLILSWNLILLCQIIFGYILALFYSGNFKQMRTSTDCF